MLEPRWFGARSYWPGSCPRDAQTSPSASSSLTQREQLLRITRELIHPKAPLVRSRLRATGFLDTTTGVDTIARSHIRNSPIADSSTTIRLIESQAAFVRTGPAWSTLPINFPNK